MPPTTVPIIRLRPLLGDGAACHFATIAGDVLTRYHHGHDFCEIFWTVDGNGRELDGEQATPMSAGSFGLVRPGDVHAFDDDGGLLFRNLAFPAAAWAALVRRYGGAICDLFAAEPRRRRGVLQPDQIRLIEHVARPLLRGRRDKAVLDRLLLMWEQVLTERPALDPPAWLAQALLHQDELREGVAAWVARCGYSHEHVTRCCRYYLGTTPRNYRARQRSIVPSGLLARE